MRGAPALLSALTTYAAPWAIVTSGTRALLSGWLRALSLPDPPASVVAEDVEAGKPDPGCYLLGRERVGFARGRASGGEVEGGANGVGGGGGGGSEGSDELLVIEDAPSGVRAGKAAGCRVLGLATTHSVESLKEAGANWVIRDLESLRVLGQEEAVADDSQREAGRKSWQGVRVEIREAWVEG